MYVQFCLYLSQTETRNTGLYFALLTRERECLTDNGNRTQYQIRKIPNEHKYIDFAAVDSHS